MITRRDCLLLLAELQQKGIDISGPFPSDTLFCTCSKNTNDYDCYIALTIYFDKENYTFELSDSIEDIEKAIHIKSFFHKDQIQISTPDRTIRKLISQYGSKNPDTIPLLDELYEYTP